MLVTWLVDRIERLIGTSVPLPAHAIEVFIAPTLFRHLGADGYCIDRLLFEEFVTDVLHRGASLSKPMAALDEAYRSAAGASTHVSHVIVCTTRPSVGGIGWIDRACVHRSLVNHERFHATTMRRSKAWHTVADGLFEAEFGDVWSGPRAAMLALPTYASMVSDGTDESWLASTEMLARVAAVLHAPIDRRPVVARYQLETDPVGLMLLSRAVLDRWSSAEGAVGWLDARADTSSVTA